MKLVNPGLTQSQLTTVQRAAPTVETASPTAGQTVVMTGGSADATMALTPSGTLATLTVTLPANATAVIGDIARITTTKAITSITINGATSILGNITAMAVNEVVSFKKTADNVWMNIQ